MKYATIIISDQPKVFAFLDLFALIKDEKILKIECPKKLISSKIRTLKKIYKFKNMSLTISVNSTCKLPCRINSVFSYLFNNKF